jgi:DNA adenine methylase
LIPFVPEKYGRYFEPFLGGGAFFFFLQPERAEISDASEPLIATYRAVKKHSDEILGLLRPLRPDRETFERIKKHAVQGPIEDAARFIFLNKACWNGLYRVNSKGIFNVPYGAPKTDFVIDEGNLVNCAKQLRRRSIRIARQDFSTIECRVVSGDFVFLDPPYVTTHNMNGFVDWNESLFSWQDQLRLAEMAARLVAKGANVLITNAAHPDIEAFYRGFGKSEFVRYSTLASNASKRGKTSEAIFFGGPAYGCGPAVLSKRGSEVGCYRRAD